MKFDIQGIFDVQKNHRDALQITKGARGYETWRQAELDACKTLQAGARVVALIMVDENNIYELGYFHGPVDDVTRTAGGFVFNEG